MLARLSNESKHILAVGMTMEEQTTFATEVEEMLYKTFVDLDKDGNGNLDEVRDTPSARDRCWH